MATLLSLRQLKAMGFREVGRWHNEWALLIGPVNPKWGLHVRLRVVADPGKRDGQRRSFSLFWRDGRFVDLPSINADLAAMPDALRHWAEDVVRMMAEPDAQVPA